MLRWKLPSTSSCPFQPSTHLSPSAAFTKVRGLHITIDQPRTSSKSYVLLLRYKSTALTFSTITSHQPKYVGHIFRLFVLHANISSYDDRSVRLPSNVPRHLLGINVASWTLLALDHILTTISTKHGLSSPVPSSSFASPAVESFWASRNSGIKSAQHRKRARTRRTADWWGSDCVTDEMHDTWRWR